MFTSPLPHLRPVAESGYLDIVKILVGKVKSLYFGNIEAQKEYFDRQNDMGCSALMWAASKGFEDIVVYLIKHGVNLDLRNLYGYTALMDAVQWEHKSVVVRLLEAGADRDIQDEKGRNALNRTLDGSFRYILINTKSFKQIEEEAEEVLTESVAFVKFLFRIFDSYVIVHSFA